MRLQNTYLAALVSFLMFVSLSAQAQSKAYKRSQPASAKVAAPSSAKADASSAAPASKKESEKLDIQELEQKYWAPKDTDFTVVQNRTYTKAKRVAASLMTGPVVNDPFNDGLTTALSINYYLDERFGFELMYQTSNEVDSDATTSFTKLVGGGVRPDFNRDDGFYGVGFNWVPFYAKMSFLGKKIIYFDMQVTPFLGIASYEQQSEVKNPVESSFAYGIDITQYFFFSKNWAVRANLHNRFYKSDVLAYKTVGSINAGDVKRSGEATTTTMFLMGLTYFF
ncbi:MAG: outer membrane beta-barrel domain-containing protein [Bdellovibrionales bacterium]|nr:outer membrane beta-barrel domain-containing protein [Bdellovibrionales bacterium]